MCMAVFSYRQHPVYRLIFAANRDELYSRPAARAMFWQEDSEILGGRDPVGGGTWLALSRSGRFAAVTNYREPGPGVPDARSRGTLVTDWLRSTSAPTSFLGGVSDQAHEFNGFNLLIGDPSSLFCYSNRGGPARELPPGWYGLSNHLLDTPWPKVTQAGKRFRRQLESGHVAPTGLFTLLADDLPAADNELPDTGVGRDAERALSPAFVRTADYGTRCSTVVLVEYDGEVHFVERTFDRDGTTSGDVSYTFRGR